MRGAKPEQTMERAGDALQHAEIHAPPERPTKIVEPLTPRQSQSVQLRADVTKRFEEVMKQELTATSFSTSVDRPLELEEFLARATAQKMAQKTPQMRPLKKAIRPEDMPFHGLTILDKFVHFAVFLLKRLERKIFGGAQKVFPVKKSAKVITSKESGQEKEKSAGQGKKLERTTPSGRGPLKGPSFQG